VILLLSCAAAVYAAAAFALNVAGVRRMAIEALTRNRRDG
jgi:hypothetical protein